MPPKTENFNDWRRYLDDNVGKVDDIRLKSRNLGIYGKRDGVARPTEEDACESIRLGYTVLSRSYGQASQPHQRSIAYYASELARRHVTHKDCKRCGENKSVMDFNADRTRKDGYDVYCAACRRELYRERCGTRRAA